MAIIEMLAVGAAVGVIAHLILRQNGYAWVGEMLLGIVGSVAVGLVYGIFIEMRTFKPQVLVASAIGAAIVLAVAVYVSIRPGGSRTVEQ